MSAFDTKPEGTTPEENIDDPFTHLVGEDKKFKTPQDLAKGKIESDRFIVDLQRQIAELQEDISSSAKVDELLKLVRDQKAPVAEKTAPDPTDPVLDADKLKALIESHVNEREVLTTRQKNLAEADKILEANYGQGAATVLHSRASELGMSVDELKEIASRNPKAFAKLIGSDAKEGSTLLGKTQRSEAGTISNAGKHDFTYYNELRRKNKALYHSVDVQAQMFKDRMSMGPAFFGN